MTTGPKPAPPTFSVGDRVTEIHRDGRLIRIATVAKVLAAGARIRTENGDDYTRRKGRGTSPTYAWEGYYSGTARAWQEGDEKGIALAGMKNRRADVDGEARREAANAASSWEIVTRWTNAAKGDEARVAGYVAERDRLDAEIAALEGGSS